MSLWLITIGSALLTAIIYYAFKACRLQHAILISLAFTTLAGFVITETVEFSLNTSDKRTSARLLDKYTLSENNQIKKTELDWKLLKASDFEISQIRTKAWSEGNSLWILDGVIKNNSDHEINAIELMMTFNDCGPNDKKTDNCKLLDKKRMEILKDLNIPPHHEGKFATTYAIQDASHNYKVNLITNKAATLQTYIIDQHQLVFKEEDLNKVQEELQAIKEIHGVDRTPICGGGGHLEKKDNHHIMLANDHLRSLMELIRC